MFAIDNYSFIPDVPPLYDGQDDPLNDRSSGQSGNNITSEALQQFKIAVHDLLATMQANISAEIIAVREELSALSNKVAALEAQVTTVTSASSSTPGASNTAVTDQCTPTLDPQKRKRRTPVHVQVLVQYM